MKKGLPKVTVAGAGFVGSTLAQRLVEKELAEIVLVDAVEGLAQGKALDLRQSAPLGHFEPRITGTNDYRDTADSDLIIITAGLARKPGMSRDDLLLKNAEIVASVVDSAVRHSKEAVLLVVTNPLDVMTYLAWKRSGFAPHRVLGMAGVLDSARYSAFVAEELGIPPKDVCAVVLGGHGDSMVPLPRLTTVNGTPVTRLLTREKIEAINQRTRDGGAEIVRLLKTGSAYYAPSASAALMAEAVLKDTGEILPSSVYLNGQYGIRGIFGGVPARLGREGVREVIELALLSDEREALRRSCLGVEENIKQMEMLFNR